jgi:hypothetical protein
MFRQFLLSLTLAVHAAVALLGHPVRTSMPIASPPNRRSPADDEVSPGAEVTAVAQFELWLNAPDEPQSPASSPGNFADDR